VYTLYYAPYPASNAVDGNNDTNALKPDHSCFHSDYEANPWWAVDLGAALAVVGILFTNRGDGSGNAYIYTATDGSVEMFGRGIVLVANGGGGGERVYTPSAAVRASVECCELRQRGPGRISGDQTIW